MRNLLARVALYVAVSLAAASMVGCVRDPASHPAPAQISVVPPPLLAPSPPVPPLPPPRARLARVACLWHTDHLSTETMEGSSVVDKLLRFEIGGPPFARVFSSGAATLEIPVALASAGGELEIESAGVTVRGHVEASDMPLYPVRAWLLAEAYLRKANVFWEGSSGAQRLTVAVHDLRRVRSVEGDASLQGYAECRDLQLGSNVVIPPADLEKALGAPGALTRQRSPSGRPFLKAGTTWLNADPDGNAVAMLERNEPPDDALLFNVQILETRGTAVRVLFSDCGGLLVGWIGRERLRFARGERVDRPRDCSYFREPAHTLGPDDVVCAHDAPLAAEAHGVQYLVGMVRAGTRIHVGSTGSGWSWIDFPEAGVRAADDASFLVRSADLGSCRRAAP